MGIFFMIPSKYRSIDVIFLRLSEEKVSLSLFVESQERSIYKEFHWSTSKLILSSHVRGKAPPYFCPRFADKIWRQSTLLSHFREEQFDKTPSASMRHSLLLEKGCIFIPSLFPINTYKRGGAMRKYFPRFRSAGIKRLAPFLPKFVWRREGKCDRSIYGQRLAYVSTKRRWALVH